MKRLLFYFLLVVQVIIISLLAIQYALIDNYGKAIKVLEKKASLEAYGYQEDELYLDYEMNDVTKRKWDAPHDMKNNEKVYVLLESDKDGIYHAVEAGKERQDAKRNQVVVAGKYQSYASDSGKIRIDYGIERTLQKEKYKKLNRQKQWVITLKIAPWGQKKIVDIGEK